MRAVFFGFIGGLAIALLIDKGSSFSVETLLGISAILLFMIWWELGQLRKINARLKEYFPTEKEQDYEWAMEDPMGHWEAHKRTKAQEAALKVRKKQKGVPLSGEAPPKAPTGPFPG